MEVVINNIVNAYLKSQLLFVPLVLLYVIINLKKLTTGSKWLIHRVTSILLLFIPLVLIAFSYIPNKNYTRFEVSPHLDIKRSKIIAPQEKNSIKIKHVDKRYNQIKPIVKSDIDSPIKNGNLKKKINHYSNKSDNRKIDIKKLIYIPPVITGILIIKLIISLFSQYFLEKKIVKNSIRDNFKGINTYYSDLVLSPFSTGIIQGKIYLPRTYYKTEKTQPILYHEKGHIDGKHIIWKLIESVNSILNWFNPLSYFYLKSSELLKELIADEEAIKHSDSLIYSKLIIDELINLNKKNNYYLATGFIKKNIIKERINNLMSPIKKATTKATKITGVIIIFISLFLTMTIGCTKTKQITEPEDYSYVKVAKMTNNNDIFQIDSDQRILTDSIVQKTMDNLISIAKGGESSISFLILKPDGTLIKEIELEKKEHEILRHTFDINNNLIVLKYDSPTGKGDLIRYFDQDNSEKLMTIKTINFLDEKNIDIKSIKLDKNNTLYIDDYDTVHVYKNGKLIKWKGREEVFSMAVSPDGVLYYIPFSDAKSIKSWDSNTNKTITIKTIYENLLLNWDNENLMILDTNGIKKYQNGEFKGYIAITEDFPDILSWWNSCFIKIGNKIYVSSHDFNKNEFYISSIEISNKNRNEDSREVLTIQVSEFEYLPIRFAAGKYNKAQNKIKVEVIQMEEYGDNWDSYIQKLNSEILSGRGPDILSLSDLPYSEYIEKGILVNLDSYIDGNNSIDKNLYMKALTGDRRDNGLYGLATSIGNSDLTFSVKESIINKYGYSGSFINMSWSELLEIAKKERKRDSNGMEIYPLILGEFEEYKDFYFSIILSLNNYFIDPKTGTINENDFKKYLTLIKTLLNDDLVKPDVQGIEANHSSIIEGSSIFSEQEIIQLWDRLSVKRHLFNNEKVSIIHPTITDRSLKYRSNLLGLMSSSKLKNEAWDFLKYLLEDEYQRGLNTNFLPIKRSVLEELTVNSVSNREDMKTTVADDYGEVTYSGIATYTKQDLNDYYESLDRYDTLIRRERDLEKLIYSQVEPYIMGNRTEEETLSAVKKRVETFINE